MIPTARKTLFIEKTGRGKSVAETSVLKIYIEINFKKLKNFDFSKRLTRKIRICKRQRDSTEKIIKYRLDKNFFFFFYELFRNKLTGIFSSK